MNDETKDREFVEDLLSRDPEVAATNFEEFRMTLENRLSQIERRARLIRQALFIGLGLTFAGFLVSLPWTLSVEAWAAIEYWFSNEWGIFNIALLVLGILALFYRLWYLPTVARAKSDLQIATIEDLQRQVAELSRRLDERSR